jgi:hypothetical protein
VKGTEICSTFSGKRNAKIHVSFLPCTLIFASIHPEVLEKSIQTCPAGKSTNSDIIIDVNVKGDEG